MKLGEAMYKQAGGASAEASAHASSSKGSPDGDDDVLDADFEEVRDDDKK